MAVAGLDSKNEILAAATAATKANKPGAPDDTAVAASAAPDFAALLQDRLGRNMALTSAEAKLQVPNRADSADRAGALNDQRPRDPGFGSADRGDAQRSDNAADRPSDRPAPAQARDDRPQSAPSPRAGNDTNNGDGARASNAADGQATAKAAPQDSAAKQAAPGTNAGQPQGPADGRAAAVKPDGGPQANGQLTAQNAQTRADGAGQAQQSGRPVTDLGANVQVTQRAATVTAPPQANLGGQSALAAQSGDAALPANAANQSAAAAPNLPATPEEAAQILASLRGQPGQAAASNASPTAQAAKAKAQAKANGGAAGATTQNNTAQQPDLQGLAAGGQPMQNPTLPKPGALGLQNALENGGRVAALSGSGKPMVSADPMTGTTSFTGHNNSVQQKTSAPPMAQTARGTPMPTPVADQIAVQIQKAAGTGSDRIQINLKPAELGRVEIKLEMAHDGRMTAVISADKPETLDMLRQDSRQLLQSLNDAGLKADQGSLSFNLSGQKDETADNDNGRSGKSGEADDEGEIAGADPFDDIGETNGFSADGRLNMRV
jgi:flagellar hook-length control protein FliK